MTDTSTPQQLQQADREKRRVAAASLAAAILLTGTKLGIGLWTNSLGILSEAAHSALDLVAAAVTLWAVRISSRPADTEHTYGHGKFENLSALFETVLLLVTCFWIISEAAGRLVFHKPFELNVNAWAFAVVILSIVVDFGRSRALGEAAAKYSSQALEADALHFSTDIWSSGVVLLGLIGVVVGERFDLPWLKAADAVAALGVAIIVVYVSVQLGKKSVGDLLDSVPKGMHDRVAAVARQVSGVESVTRLRLRRSGPEIFADLTLSVRRGAAFERAHDIAHEAEAAVRAVLPGADVVVHVEPVAAEAEDVTTVVRLLAARHGLGAHGIRIYEENQQRWLELHLEVSESLLLDEAHRQATEFERELRSNLPGVTRIITHIEPVGDGAATIRGEPAAQAQVQKAIADFLAEYSLPVRPHDIRVQMAAGELAVSFHCALAPTTAITEAHQLTVRLEEYLRSHVSGLGRVAIHVEPDKK
ncbi:MAG: cation-efflux pump [Planctomycetaceae bacterium]|nr:cation-efflux pump [Planctomycetaceae bacterium]